MKPSGSSGKGLDYRAVWRGGCRLLAALAGTSKHRDGSLAGAGDEPSSAEPTDDVAVLVGEASALLKARRFEAAEKVLSQALAQSPDHLGALEKFARVAQRTRRWADALDRWRALSDRRPDYAWARLQMANSLIQLGLCAEAESVLSEALNRWSDHPELMAAMARAAQRDGRWSDALDRWRALGERHPDQVETELKVAKATAYILMEMRRYREAERVLAGARSRWPEDTGLLESVARLAQREQRWAEALAHWKELADRRPGQVNAWIHMINVLSELGRTEEIERVLREAMKRWPNHPKLMEDMARALERDQMWSEALARWKEIGDSHPSYASSRVGQHIAICELRLGRVEAAGRALEEAVGTRAEAAIFQRLFGQHAPYIPYYGRQIEDAFRNLD